MTDERSRREVEVHQLKEHFNLVHGFNRTPPKGTKNRNALIEQIHENDHDEGLVAHPREAR